MTTRNTHLVNLILDVALLGGLLLIAAGYWGPWVWASPAGLRVLGLDLAEYVKFIAQVRSGQIPLLREVFYLPLLTLSLSLSLLAHRREYRLPALLRWLLNLLAIPVALAMLPPAWTPPLLTTPEFVKQTVAIGVCLAAAVLSYPLLRRLPAWLTAMALILLALPAMLFPTSSFMRLRPALDAIYGHPIVVGRGPWEMALGLALVVLSFLLAIQHRRTVSHSERFWSGDASPRDASLV